MLQRVLLGCACIGLLGGCGGASGPEKVTLSGKVTYQGKPLEDGDISFRPVPGTNAPPTSTVIKNGHYTAGDRAAIASGTFNVQINGYKKREGAVKDSAGIERPGVDNREQILPEKFNTKSTIEQVTIVKGKSSQTKDFDLKD